MESRADILSRLRQDILSLQGSRAPMYASDMDVRLGPVTSAFPNKTFPVSAVHEFVCAGQETWAPTAGFIASILSFLTTSHKPCIWISKQRLIFPPALQTLGLDPHRIIFIEAKKEKDLLWIMEESLRCDSLSAVVCDVKEVSFIASRRLQLAVEESHVTGIIIRNEPRNLATACDARWRVTSMPTEANGLPGLNYPHWNIELLKVRNGKPGSWQASWRNGRFYFEQNIIRLLHQEKKKTG